MREFTTVSDFCMHRDNRIKLKITFEHMYQTVGRRGELKRHFLQRTITISIKA